MKLHRLHLRVPRAAHWSLCGILAASALLWPLSEKAHDAAYTFTNIADSDGIFAPAGNNIIGIGTAPLALNNAGMIAFTSRLDDGGRGVFTGDGVSIQTIGLTSGPIFSVLGSASINSAGTVAFFGILDSGVRGVFTSNGGQITNIAPNTEPTFDRFGFPAVNDAGTVGFQVRFTDGSRGILTRGGGSTVTIAAESGPIFSGVGGGYLSINSAGTVAFFAALENGQAGYFASNGGAPTTIAFGNLFPDGLSLNDAGNASFIFGGAVYTGNGGVLTTVADTSGPFAGFGTYSEINNFGEVVFLAGLDSGGGGIFTGPDPVADKVIGIGDSLFGSSLVSTDLIPLGQNFHNIDINDLGQVAFHYALADGRQGIAVASPVPEQSSLGLLLAALGLIAARSKARLSGCRFSPSETSMPKNPMKPNRIHPFVSRATPWSLCGIIVASALIWPLSGKARAAAYTFTNIADADGIFAKAGNNREGIGTAQLSINNAGTVAFRSFLDDGGTGVFVGNGGPIQSIALSSDPIFRVVVGASINSGGTVAFLGILDSGGQGIFTSNNSQITTIALNTEPTFSAFGAPLVNDAGRVGFNVLLTDGSRSIVTRNGGLTTTIAAESGPIFSGVGGNISINSSGTVAFFGRLENGQFGIFSGSGGPPTTVSLGSNFRDGVSINDAGTVTFNDRTGSAVYVRNSSGLMVVADTSGPYAGFGPFSSINNLGKVVFLAGLDAGGSGIFTGFDPVTDKVIRTGDSLFGSNLVSADIEPLAQIFGNMDINDLGQVAFHYQLADGRQGIAVANPVPEPSSLSLLIIASLLAARRKSHPADRR